MKKNSRHTRRFMALTGFFALYAVVFAIANPHLFGRPAAPVQEERIALDPEAYYDEDYFNSPQVKRALSLDDPSPYNALGRSNLQPVDI